jgi:hypothetical protein
MRALLLLFIFSSLSAKAQWKDYLLTRKGDTLNRIDLAGKKQGPWVVSVPELRGERGYEEEGYFVNDQKEGIWKKFSPEGVKIAEENYRWGKLHGKQLYYSFNGGLIREESWRAMDPANAYDTVAVYDLKDPDKMVGEVVVKNEGLSMRHGRFVYYDPRTGSILQTEHYVMNKLQEDVEVKPVRDTTPKAVPRVIQEFDKKKKRN